MDMLFFYGRFDKVISGYIIILGLSYLLLIFRRFVTNFPMSGENNGNIWNLVNN